MTRPCLFLDRDGVINVKMSAGGYVCRWEEFQLLPAVVDWIRIFNALEFLVIVVTNQRCVAKGLISPDSLADIHTRMKNELANRGAIIHDVFICPHEEGTCDCRKPRPGLIHQAQERWNIDLGRSLLIGDSESDRQLAEACGLKFLWARDGHIVDPPTKPAD